MRNLPQLPDGYFERFKNKPVKIKPFDPRTKKVATNYIAKLKKFLSGFEVEYRHRGSTAFGIPGKNDIEIGIYPVTKDWKGVLKKLTEHFGKVDNLEENYARFNDLVGNFEIEVIMMKGYDAEVDKRLNDYLMNHPGLLKEYEELKYKHANSKRDYMIQKDNFLRKIVAMIPE